MAKGRRHKAEVVRQIECHSIQFQKKIKYHALHCFELHSVRFIDAIDVAEMKRLHFGSASHSKNLISGKSKSNYYYSLMKTF